MWFAILRRHSMSRILADSDDPGTDDLVPHLARHDHAAKQVLEHCEMSDAREVDERAGVGDDDHRDSSVATSFLRSSTE